MSSFQTHINVRINSKKKVSAFTFWTKLAMFEVIFFYWTQRLKHSWEWENMTFLHLTIQSTYFICLLNEKRAPLFLSRALSIKNWLRWTLTFYHRGLNHDQKAVRVIYIYTMNRDQSEHGKRFQECCYTLVFTDACMSVPQGSPLIKPRGAWSLISLIRLRERDRERSPASQAGRGFGRGSRGLMDLMG